MRCNAMQCEDMVLRNGMPPQKMQTPVFDSAVPRKKMPMANRLGNRQRQLERGACYEGMDGRRL